MLSPGGTVSAPGVRSSYTRPLRIGVFGHYGNRNLGDEAIIQAVVENLRVRAPNVVIHGFSLDPEDTAARYGVPAYHIRRVASAPAGGTPTAVAPSVGAPAATRSAVPDVSTGARGSESLALRLWRIVRRVPGLPSVARGAYRIARLPGVLVREARMIAFARTRVRELDLLIVAGSNQFLDNFGGMWGFPYTLFRWAMLARLAGTRVAFASVGAGPLESRGGRLLVRTTLRWFADYVSYRDEQSKVLVERSRPPRAAVVMPDLAHSLLDLPHRSPTGVAGRSLVVGINPMPVYDARYWYIDDPARYAAYVDTIAEIFATLVREGNAPFFFSSQPSDELVMDDVFDRIESRLGRALDRESFVRRPRTVRALMEVLDSADMVVATRFHGALLSVLSERPTYAICYHRKAASLMIAAGQERYAVILEQMTAANALRDLADLRARAGAITAHLHELGIEYRRRLDSQYDVLLQLADDRASQLGVGRMVKGHHHRGLSAVKPPVGAGRPSAASPQRR